MKSPINDVKIASVWDQKADDFREVAEKLKGSPDPKDMMTRATLLRLADDFEAAGRSQRAMSRERGKRP